MRFSIVVPAHNEEHFLPRGLEAIATAQAQAGATVEVVVVANRCTDATVEIAEAAGAVVVEHGGRNLAAVRNAGAAAATGDVIVTIDADSRMAPNTFREVRRLLETGRYVGGGTKYRLDRSSLGIRATIAVVELTMLVTRLGGVMFWCARSDFEAVGGFDESWLVAEDISFARRLTARGRATGRRFTTLRSAPVLVSSRKFDRFGDWHMFGFALRAGEIRRALDGRDTAFVDRYFFDFNG